MSQFKNTEPFAISSDELPERLEGKRVIGAFGIEMSDALPHRDINGRTDWFVGREYKLSFAQLEELSEKLNKCIGMWKQLEAAGHVVIKRD